MSDLAKKGDRMHETRQLAEYIVGLKNEDLTPELIDKTKQHLLDQMGCQTTFATLPWGKAAYRYVAARGDRGTSTVAYYGLKTSAEAAAFANGLFGHGCEMDDDDESTTSHPGVGIVPATLAVGEAVSASGLDLINAMVVGYDAMIRIGLASRAIHANGFHETAAIGTFGATAAACKLYGLNVEETTHALGIAASESCGIGEYSCSGGSIKRAHAGFAASNGVRAAMMAKCGITGPLEALEGKKGWLRVFTGGEYYPEKITENLGTDFKIMRVGMKPYCCCAGIHGVIDATEAIRQQGATVDNVESIAIMMRPRETRDVGTIIEPYDVVSAQFSARFGCALRLVKGSNGYHDYVMDNVNDPQIREFARNVIWETDEDDTYLSGNAAPARVTITLKDGTVLQETVNHAIGTIDNPLDWDGVVQKYRETVEGVVSAAQADAAVKRVENIAALEDVASLTRLLVPDGTM